MKPNSRGFTLVELLVVTAIVVVITSVVLVDNARFGGIVRLENLAYDIALTVRQAQVYGISVSRYGSAFTASYGLHFDTIDPTHYELFADAAGTGLYLSTENISPSPFTMSGGFQISKLCAPADVDAASCTSVSKLDILFKRPEPDAWINVNDNATCSTARTGCPIDARIVLRSPRGDTTSVIIESNGQITVKRR